MIGLLLGLQMGYTKYMHFFVCGTVGQMRNITVLLNGLLVPI